MTQNFEYISYKDAEWIAMLEHRAADLERRLLEVSASGVLPPQTANAADAGGPGGLGPASPGADGRTEALISRGRVRAARRRGGWLRVHWRAAGLALMVATMAGLVAGLVVPGGGPEWPASVTRVQGQVAVACLNPDVAAEPSGVNFACAKPTQAVLWVFSLLTSGNDPGYVDRATGRRGLEPITPAQGGNIFWSLNLHHVYDPASPGDSLQVAARAINNIIGGATLTSPAGAPVVEPGLESRPANCLRYTGSARLAARAGFPARCARPVTPAGAQALVADVFRQWMSGAPPQAATEAGVLFAHAADPGNLRVQGILATLPQ